VIDEKAEWYQHTRVGTYLVTFWLGLFFLLIIGFGYSFFWCATSIIYLLLRRRWTIRIWMRSTWKKMRTSPSCRKVRHSRRQHQVPHPLRPRPTRRAGGDLHHGRGPRRAPAHGNPIGPT